jgi:hypothetical protein
VTIGDVQVSGTTATATFSSPDADIARFECSLDGAAYVACASPKQVTGLAAGAHTVSVRPVDKADNVGPSVSRTFTIDSPAAQPSPSPSPSPSAGSSTTKDTVAPRVTLLSKSVRVSKRGTVSVKVGCPATETRCTIKLALQRGHSVVAHKTVTVAGGKTVSVTLQLTRALRRQLSSHRSVKLTAVLTASDAAGNKRTTKRSLTIRG